ncbi:regulatory protein RecX [Hoyosella rhizosphaerae]|uniref:Regulatory protein RecX n=1 Tax=Hoyosella rhizosphaerae TaxID=1755582 RepID=A0A916U4W8_9ACTN|nr:regulatory protein RecX [Hoyosella rhizosphaerae]MBN4926335.1 regulatory protein RecX [Hoyosella rhizosphaerae]GGC60159.1 regulatory protein RecX [Hoyosella rhizosphaerae]
MSRHNQNPDTQNPEPQVEQPAESKTPEEWAARAKQFCLRWLGARAHTRAELAEKMRRKGIPEDIGESVLDRLTKVHLIDDNDFAHTFARSRHQYSGKGRAVLAQELKRKGVGENDVRDALSTISDEDERNKAHELVTKRLRSLTKVDWSDPNERQRAVRKLVGMLARRGYPPGLSYGIVADAIRAEAPQPIEIDTFEPESFDTE